MTATLPVCFDEMHGLAGEVLPHYRRYADWLAKLAPEVRAQKFAPGYSTHKNTASVVLVGGTDHA